MLYSIRSLKSLLISSNRYFCTAIKVVFLYILISSPLIAEVDFMTLDSFNIYSTSEHDLIVSKRGQKDTSNVLGFRMQRPFCVCKNPVFILAIDTDKEVGEGSKVKGTITVDMTKPMETILQVIQKFDSGTVLFRPLIFPSLRTSKVVRVKTELGTSETFITKGIDNAMQSSESMCNSDYLYEHVEPKAKEMKV